MALELLHRHHAGHAHKTARAAARLVWKTITLGAYKTADEYRAAMKKAGMSIDPLARNILGSAAFTASEMETEVDLVTLSVGELGFADGARRCDICTHAVKNDLELCPVEVGAALRLAYDDQPKNEWLHIAMQNIDGPAGSSLIFTVGRRREPCLSTVSGHPLGFWHAGLRIVFVQHRLVSAH